MPSATDQPEVETASVPTWPAPVRTGVSILLLIHLVIVITVPLWMVQPGPSSTLLELPSWRWLRSLSANYVQATNASHGYAFFAPDPGRSSTLIRYKIEFADDRETIEGQFPDLNEQWPRLLYHRHFMLSEQLGARMQPQAPQGPGETWQVSEESRAWATSFAEHLLNTHGAEQVSLDIVRHNVPGMEDLREGMKLTDERLYETFPISPFVVVQRDVEGVTAPIEVIPAAEEILPTVPQPEPLP